MWQGWQPVAHLLGKVISALNGFFFLYFILILLSFSFSLKDINCAENAEKDRSGLGLGCLVSGSVSASVAVSDSVSASECLSMSGSQRRVCVVFYLQPFALLFTIFSFSFSFCTYFSPSQSFSTGHCIHGLRRRAVCLNESCMWVWISKWMSEWMNEWNKCHAPLAKEGTSSIKNVANVAAVAAAH